MPRKKAVKDPQDEIDATCKLLCDEARNHMKVRNYIKALAVYNKVSFYAMKKYKYIRFVTMLCYNKALSIKCRVDKSSTFS